MYQIFKFLKHKGHLVVSGYDKDGFKGVAKIVARITYKGNTCEVLKIGYRAFYDCQSLTTLTIPNSITYIEAYAFQACSGLTSIHCMGTTPPGLDYSSFTNDNYQTATLYVPIGSYSVYSNNYYWKNFKNIVEE